MPLQIWTHDQRPELIMAGAQGLASGLGQGFGQAGDAFAKALEKRREESKRLNTAGKSAKTFLKLIAEANGQDGTEDQNLSSEEAVAKMLGSQQAIGYQKATAELSEAIAQAKQRKAAADNEVKLKSAYRDFGSRGRAPGDVAFDALPEEFTRQTSPQNVGAFFDAMGQADATPDNNAVDLMRLIAASQAKPQGMGPEVLARFGFVPSGGQVNPNGTASITFAPPPAPAPTVANPIKTADGAPTGKATFGDKVIDLSPPNSEGKTLTQSETQMLGALDQAETDLSNLESLFEELGPDWGGPVSGRVKSTVSGGQNPNIAAVQNAITAATPNLARGVFREVGVLTDEDVKRYQALLPTAYDTDAVRKVKMGQLRERIKEGRKETMSNLRKAGRDLTGFDKPSRSAELDRTPVKLADEVETARRYIQSGKNPDAVKKLFKQRTGQDFPE